MSSKNYKFKIYYISELNIPNKSAYSIHVMKMCEAFSKLGFESFLYTINNKNLTKTFKSYNVKYKFKIISVFKNFKKLNFLSRVIFSKKILSNNFEKDSILISRSIVFALIASTFKKNIILELHHEIKGFSKLLYIFLKYFGLINNLKFIFLHKNLKNFYNVDPKKI